MPLLARSDDTFLQLNRATSSATLPGEVSRNTTRSEVTGNWPKTAFWK